MKKRLWTLCLAVAAVFCLCFGLAACGGDPTALATPTGVKVEGDTLKWDAVEGATSGYTVKISAEGADDKTALVVDATSLDLTTVTEKLTEGENKLAVKANATEELAESAYSEPVTYTYTAPAKTALDKPTGVTVTGHTLSWNAVTGATAGYTVKIGDDETTKVTTTSLDLNTVASKLELGPDNTIAVKANATAANFESLYSNAVTYTHKTAFAAPTGVKVEGNILSWNAVTDATGYTVKIGDGAETAQNTVVTGATQLNLTEANVTGKLADGENNLSVKANANEEKYHTESVYSAAVKYTATITEDALVQAYVTCVEAINVTGFDQTKTKADADAIQQAIADAEAAYTSLTTQFPEAASKSEVTQAKATFEAAKETYDGVMDAANEFITDYKEAVEAAIEIIEAEADYAALTEAQTEADTAHTAYEGSNLAQSLAAADTEADIQSVNDDYATIAKTVTEWETAIEEAVTALTIDTELDDENDATAEAVIAEANTALAAEDDLPEYVKNATDYTDAKGDLEDKKEAAEQQLTSSVATLKDNIDREIADKNVTSGHYETLVDLKDQVEKLGAYATGLLKTQTGEEKTETIEKIQEAIDEVLAVPVDVEKDEMVFFNNDKPGENEQAEDYPAHLVIIRKYVNVIGEGLKLENDLTEASVTASEVVTTGDAAGGSTTLNGEKLTVKWNDTSKAYIITILFTRIKYSEATASDKVEITYTVTKPEIDIAEYEETQTTVVVGTNSHSYEGICFDHAHEIYKGAGQVFQLQGVGNPDEPVKVSVYEEGDIEYADDYIRPIDLPLFTWDSTEVSSLDALKAKFAAMPAYLNRTITVRILVWQKYEESGVMRYSATASGSLSDPIALEITKEDLLPRLPTAGDGTVVYEDGSVLLKLPDKWDETLANALDPEGGITAEEVHDLISIKVNVTLTVTEAGPEEEGSQTKEEQSFIVDMPAGLPTISGTVMKFNIQKLFGDTPENGTYTISAQLIRRESATAYADKLRDSYTFAGNDGNGIAWNFTVSEADTRLSTHLTSWHLDYEPGNDHYGNIDYNWAIFTSDKDLHEHVYINVYDATSHKEDLTTYAFTEGDIFVRYEIVAENYVGWKNANGDNLALDDVILNAWIEIAREEETIQDANYTFVFAMQVIANQEAKDFGYSDSEIVYATVRGGDTRASKDYKFTEADVKATSENQVNFTADNGGNFEFLRAEGKNGWIFTQKKAAYVEMKLSKDGEDTTYTVYIFHESADDKVYIYKDTEKTGEALDCAAVGNSYVSLNGFNDWMNRAFSTMEFDVKDWKVTTRVHVDKATSLWLVDGDWSEDPATYPAG